MTVRVAHTVFLNCAAVSPVFCACPVRIRRAAFGGSLQHLAGQQKNRRFDNRHQHIEKRQQHQGEIDRRSSALTAEKPPADKPPRAGADFLLGNGHRGEVQGSIADRSDGGTKP
jgi:hypothetical protein